MIEDIESKTTTYSVHKIYRYLYISVYKKSNAINSIIIHQNDNNNNVFIFGFVDKE